MKVDGPCKPIRGIIPQWSVPLGSLAQDDWIGCMIRPIHFTDSDPAMFSVVSVSSQKGSDVLSSDKITHLSSNLDTSSNSELNSLTHFDYFVKRYTHICALNPCINQNQFLVSCLRLTRHQNSAQYTAGIRKKKGLTNKSADFMPDACFLHPFSTWIWFLTSIIPTILYQFRRAQLIAQFHEELLKVLDKSRLLSIDEDTWMGCGSNWSVIMPDRSDLAQSSNLSDAKVNLETSEDDQILDCQALQALPSNEYCPHPSKLVEPTTTLAARDSVNLERLEFLGDSLLNFVTTLVLYNSNDFENHLYADEGIMTSRRSYLVSNACLSQKVLELDWTGYCTKDIFSPSEHFLPPCYTVIEEVGLFFKL